MPIASLPSEALEARRRLLIDAAARADVLVVVSTEDAAAWRAEWRALLRARAPRRLRMMQPRQGIPRLSRPPLRSELPPVGSWVSFRPHISSASEVFQVVAFVPVGTAINDVLSPSQMRILQDGIRQRCTHGDRVVLGEPGGMHLISSLRTALAGAVVARATIIPQPTFVSPSRLVAPLAADTEVSWEWHSSFGLSRRSGVVVAYVPGGIALEEAAPGLKISSRLRRLSNLDRYLVRVSTGGHLTPPAFLLERPPVLEDSCSTAS